MKKFATDWDCAQDGNQEIVTRYQELYESEMSCSCSRRPETSSMCTCINVFQTMKFAYDFCAKYDGGWRQAQFYTIARRCIEISVERASERLEN